VVAEGLAVSRPAITASGIEVCCVHDNELASGVKYTTSQGDEILVEVRMVVHRYRG
jgi:hypothetical protein